MPVNDWTPTAGGGVENAVLDMLAGGAAAELGPQIVAQAEMRLLDLSSGDALTIYAKKRYKQERFEANHTIQNVRIKASPGAPPYNFAAGDLWVKGPGTNRYQSIDPVTLSPNATADVPAQAKVDQDAAYLAFNAASDALVDASARVVAANKAYEDSIGGPQVITDEALIALILAQDAFNAAGTAKAAALASLTAANDALQDATDEAAAAGVNCRFRAEFPGSSYNDVAGTITSMVTAPAGVTCVNVRPSEFAPTSTLGTSTGKISASFIHIPQETISSGVRITTIPGYSITPTVSSIRVKITASGNVGSGAWSYSLDGGATWIGAGPIAATFTIMGQGVLKFVDGVNPSFQVGDIFTLIVADAILARGTDEESDQNLRQRCRYRWMSLSDVPTEGLVTLWCFMASVEIARVRVDADQNTPGGILVKLASATGPASPAAQIAVQDFISARLLGYRKVKPPTSGFSPAESVQASSAIAFPVTVASTPKGKVTVDKSQLVAVQQAADDAWSAYLAGVEIGGLIVYPELIQAIMDAGAVDVTGLQINGGTADIQLAPGYVAVVAEGVSLTSALAWEIV